MERHGYGSGSRPSWGGDRRRLEIMSGKGSSGVCNNHNSYVTRPHLPSPPPVPLRVTWPSQVATKPWGFRDPEMKRKRRIARYKVYAVEGKVKHSLRKGFCWIKNKCSQIINGY